MDLEKIYKKSIDIALKYKPLWVIGIAAAVFSGGGLNLSQNTDISDLGELPDIQKNINSQKLDELIAFFAHLFRSIPTEVWLALGASIILSIAIGFIFSLFVKNWAIGSLIGGINDAYDDKTVTLKTASEHGIRSLKSLIWLNIVPWFLYFLVVLFFVSTSVILFLVFWPLGLLAAILFAVPTFLSYLAIAAIQIWATRVAVIESKSGKEAFSEGWRMVKEHILKMIGLGCLNTIIGCFSGCLLSCLAGIIILPFVISGAAFYFISPNKATVVPIIILAALLGILLFLLLNMLFNGIYTVFNYSTWNVLYRQILEENENEQSG